MPRFFSVTNRSWRKPCNHDHVRSATHRKTPSPLPCAARRFARFGSLPHACNSSRCGSKSYARSPYSTSGRCFGRPGLESVLLC